MTSSPSYVKARPGVGRRFPARGASRLQQSLLGIFTVFLVLGLSANVAHAAPARASFPGSVRNLAEKAAWVAPVPADRKNDEIEFHVALKMQAKPELLGRLSAGQRIAAAELEKRYLPRAAEYNSVVAWLKGQGLTITREDAHRLGVFAKGSVAQVSQALQVTFARVTTKEGEFTSAQTAPSLPAEIAGAVLAVNGLQPHLHPRSLLMRPEAVNSNQPPYLVNQVLSAYNAAGLAVNGSGEKIAILIDTFPLNSDLTAFWAKNSIPQSLANIEKVNVTAAASLPSPSGEETLDVEWSSGIAPAAKIRIYATNTLSFNDLDKGLQRLISDLPSQTQIHQLSISLGLGETDISADQLQTDSQYFAAIASFGVTIFASSGDNGAFADADGVLQPSYFSTDPSVTAVGGTSLSLTSTGAESSERGWSGSGGGKSTHFSRPSWQVGSGVPAGTNRLVPDVASAADPNTGAYLYLHGSVEQVGGTSWSAPTWAAFSALINQARLGNGQAALGVLNPKIYPLNGTSAFRDITLGANGDYSCTPGFDEVTGLGAPNVGVLLQALAGKGGTAPAITGFSPTSGDAGATVTITGSDMSGTKTVNFNGTSAAFTLISATQISATVPANATSGVISLTNATGQTASSFAIFTVVHDTFANPEGLAATDAGTAAASNVGAVKQAGAPNISGNAGGALVWFSWTAPEAAPFTFNTAGSSFNTLVGVYTGSTLANLQLVTDAGGTAAATDNSVTFEATAGTTYFIGVDGYNGATGSLSLAWRKNSAALQITSFAPTSGAPGDTVTITGVALSNVSAVSFNGVAAANFTALSDTQVAATVPANATTGPILVTSSGGTAASVASFLVLSNVAESGSTLLYATDFAGAEGYVTTQPLAGQKGWMISGSGGNGILSNAFGAAGQQAFVGGQAPRSSGNPSTFLWHPVEFTPTAANPVVKFKVTMSVKDSSNSNYDDFQWVVFNSAGKALFTLDFDNGNNEIYYLLNGPSSGYVDTGVSFVNGTVYQLEIDLDYSHKTWSALLNGRKVVTGEPISVASEKLDFGDVDATWTIYNPATPGTNEMIFGDYSVVATPGAPSISSEPQSQSVIAGQTVAFSVVATGAAPLTYEWAANGKAIPGATGSALTLTGAQPANSGSYFVRVANALGSVTSSVATLTVSLAPAAPSIITQPVGETVAGGQSLVLAVKASGSPPPTYQWALNGQAIPGATAPTLVLREAQASAAGSYTVKVSNSLGAVTSNAAVISVGASFASVASTYRGVLGGSGANGFGGPIQVTTSGGGGLTGSFFLLGRRFAFVGTLSAAGTWSGVVGALDGQPVTVSLQLGITGTKEVTGTVEAEGNLYSLTMMPPGYQGGGNLAPQAGRYTVLLPPDPRQPGTAYPQGMGWGLAAVDAGGTVRFEGRLGDGTLVTMATVLTAAGEWIFYAPLYGSQGWIEGTITFDATQGNSDLSGSLAWVKPPAAGEALYPKGFSGQTPLVGSRYVPGMSPVIQFTPNAAAGEVTLSDGNLTADITAPVTLNANDTLSVNGANPSKLSLRILPGTGLIGGAFTPPGGRAAPMEGVVFQKTNEAAGLFLGKTESGAFTLTSP